MLCALTYCPDINALIKKVFLVFYSLCAVPPRMGPHTPYILVWKNAREEKLSPLHLPSLSPPLHRSGSDFNCALNSFPLPPLPIHKLLFRRVATRSPPPSSSTLSQHVGGWVRGALCLLHRASPLTQFILGPLYTIVMVREDGLRFCLNALSKKVLKLLYIMELSQHV